MELHTIGIDLGKTVFHLVGLNLQPVEVRIFLAEPCGNKDTRCD